MFLYNCHHNLIIVIMINIRDPIIVMISSVIVIISQCYNYAGCPLLPTLCQPASQALLRGHLILHILHTSHCLHIFTMHLASCILYILHPSHYQPKFTPCTSNIIHITHNNTSTFAGGELCHHLLNISSTPFSHKILYQSLLMLSLFSVGPFH